MSFHVGQKVVCVDNSGFEKALTYRGIYTVVSISGLWFEGYLLLAEANPDGGGYLQRRFRPLVERKTNISVFTAMLTNEKVNA